ncbi:MAG: serine/threonine-protein phosphatase [Bacteroidia bacterium]|nr:serine/threonine-protein phosphatase [Bacteroidia bacterium]
MTKKIKIILSFILLSVACNDLLAQNNEISELRSRAAKADKDSAAKCYARIAYLSTQMSPDTVVFYAQKAIAISSNTNIAKGDAILQIGNSFSMRQENDSAFAYYEKALNFYKSINFEKGIAKAEQSFAIVYRNIEDIDKSILRAKGALVIYKKLKWQLGIINVYNLLANNFVFKKQYDSAIYYLRNTLALSKAEKDSVKYFLTLKSYADVLLEVNKADSSVFLLNKCSEYMTRNNGLTELIGIEQTLGYINFKYLSNYTNANKHFYKAYALIKQTGVKNNYKLVLDGIYTTYIYENRNRDSIMKYLTLQQMWMDTLNSDGHMKFIKELQTKYETEKKDLEIKQANSELNLEEEKNKRKTIIIWLGTAAFVGTLFFLIIAFINYKKAKKANLIIQNQNLVLELQKKEVEDQKHIIEEKQNEIISSINYAQRIQSAVLTGDEVWKKISKHYFILFQPRDIVSGDFYWAHVLSNGRAVFALADCTGHGVPGGFMSMLGNSFLNELVVENKLFKADEILNRLRDKVIAALFQKGQTEQKDGMDMILCVWNKMDNTLEFAGANNALYIVRDKQITEYKGDKMPIGSYLEENKKFTSQKITLQTNDVIYLSTDGFSDQFGGEKGKKFRSKQLEELLVEVSNLTAEEQKQKLANSFAQWRKNFEQTDDVSIIGIKVI